MIVSVNQKQNNGINQTDVKRLWKFKKNLVHAKNFGPTQKKLIHVKRFDSRKNSFNPRNPRKNYDPCEKYFELRSPCKNSTQPMHPRNSWIHVTHVTTLQYIIQITIRRYQFNLLVYGRAQPYFNKKFKKNTKFWLIGFL